MTHCIPISRSIYSVFWNDIIVQPNQLHFHCHKVLHHSSATWALALWIFKRFFTISIITSSNYKWMLSMAFSKVNLPHQQLILSRAGIIFDHFFQLSAIHRRMHRNESIWFYRKCHAPDPIVCWNIWMTHAAYVSWAVNMPMQYCRAAAIRKREKIRKIPLSVRNERIAISNM